MGMDPFLEGVLLRISKQQDNLFGDRKEFVYYYPGATRIAEKASAPIKGKSHTIEVSLDLTGRKKG